MLLYAIDATPLLSRLFRPFVASILMLRRLQPELRPMLRAARCRHAMFTMPLADFDAAFRAAYAMLYGKRYTLRRLRMPCCRRCLMPPARRL